MTTSKELKLKFMLKNSLGLADLNVFLKKNKQIELFTSHYRLEFFDKKGSKNDSDDTSSSASNAVDSIIERNLDRRKNFFSTLETRIEGLIADITKKKITPTDGTLKKDVVPYDEVNALLTSLKNSISKSNAYNDKVILDDLKKELGDFLTNNKLRINDLFNSPENQKFLTSVLETKNLKLLNNEINEKFIVQGLRKILPKNIVIKKSSFNYFIVKPNSNNESISELDLIPSKNTNLRQKPEESFGISPNKTYLTNGSLETRIILNNGETKEKRVLLPYPSINETQISQYPNDFEKASISYKYEQKDYDFLIKPQKIVMDDVECIVTPVFLYENAFYTASEVFLESYIAKPSKKASVKSCKFLKSDQIAKQKADLARSLRDMEIDDDEDGAESKGDE